MLRADELDYPLPEVLIATRPAEPRDSARLLVTWRNDDRLEHRTVRDLPEYLRQGDVLVLNTTAVAPARIVGRRLDSERRIDGLFLREHAPGQWLLMLRGRGRLREGDRLELLLPDDQPSSCVLTLTGRDDERWVARLDAGSMTTMGVLQHVGRTPLPPYILKSRGGTLVDDALDRSWYQTVFADPSRQESVAAPTAGLHFTPGLLETIAARGVRRADVVLHVGPSTFKPVSAPTMDQHRMDSEPYEVPASTISLLHAIQRERARGLSEHHTRIVAVGTTTVRTLESLPADLAELAAAGRSIRGSTDLLIAPPHEFRHVDALLTNFHLPRSTLMALVAAMLGLDRLKAIYAEAVRMGYRFYSYGDAMIILP